MRLPLRPVLLLLALTLVAGCVVAPYPPHARHGYAHGHYHAGPPHYAYRGYGPPRHWHRPPGHYRGW